MDLDPPLLFLVFCAIAAAAGALDAGMNGSAGFLVRLVPELQVGHPLLLCSDSYRGDSDEVEGRRISLKRRLALSSYSSPPVTLLDEGRPFSFLPACEPKGRQLQSLLGGSGWQFLRPWRSPRAKWFVPGAGGIQSEEELVWPRSLFIIPVRGPFCKSQGLCFSLLFLLDFFVNCTAPQF